MDPTNRTAFKERVQAMIHDSHFGCRPLTKPEKDFLETLSPRKIEGEQLCNPLNFISFSRFALLLSYIANTNTNTNVFHFISYFFPVSY